MREKVFETVYTMGNILILDCVGNAPFEEAKFTYSIDGRQSNCYFTTADGAVLGALGNKYLGLNSQFGELACKMLGIME